MTEQAVFRQTKPIPQPPGKFLVGNLTDIAGPVPILELMRLAREYGPIYQLSILNRTPMVIVSGYKLVNELCDEGRFDKFIGAGLTHLRGMVGDGLFTAHTQEPNWRKAHTILLPAFGQRAITGYFPQMLDIAEQLMEKWERLNADEEVDVSADMTRLTLDTIGLCGFDYRFNSFYRETPHPFVVAMVENLTENQERMRRIPLQDRLMIHKHHLYEENRELMYNLVDHLIQERKAQGGTEKKDLLGYMLSGVDKETGEKLDDANIRYQIITFLVAGHETTSGLLSFALYFLLRNPAVLAKAYAEVDLVLGTDPSISPTDEQVRRLQYVTQVLKETLRLWPTAPGFSRSPYAEEAVIGEQYLVKKEQQAMILTPMLHRDASVWGAGAEDFRPERFTPQAEQSLPPNAYHPFGTGQRACIGRQFAMQEAILALGMILQRFQLIDPHHYQLKIKETLTIKPDMFKIQVKRRTARGRSTAATAPMMPITPTTDSRTEPLSTPDMARQHHTPLLILYGSNLGTSEDVASRIASEGLVRGFTSATSPLDDYVNRLPKDGLVVIVTSSYNGTPPDNAEAFCHWLKDETIAADALKGINYTVFGCGNREWATTFQAIPRLIDTRLEQCGARRVYPRGEGDASGDFDSAFQFWYQPLWQEIAHVFSLDLEGQAALTTDQFYQVEVLSTVNTPHPFAASFGAKEMNVLVSRELQQRDANHPSGRSTRHIEIALPDGVSYQAGDHLGVLPRNSEIQTRRAVAHFHFDRESRVRLHKSDIRRTLLPIGEAVSVYDLLAEYVELQEPATRTQIKHMLDFTRDVAEKAKLSTLIGDDEVSLANYTNEILAKRITLLDLLETSPSCELPFGIFLEVISPLRPRYYSIASSPLVEQDRCSIAVGVVQGPARSGHGEFEGVCSGYLSHLKTDDLVYGFVRDTKSHFRLPPAPSTPLIMIGPGTGLAPFRGFLQERVALKAQGQTIGQSLLFFGCRHPEQDFIYQNELEEFVRHGVTELFVAFSRLDGQKMYVQDKIKENKEQVWQLLQAGAIVYVCGDSSKMAPDVRNVFATLYQEKMGKSKQEAEQWLNELVTQNRYLVDVWGA